MSKDNKKWTKPFKRITGMWKRTSTSRVGKNGKPEPYWYGKVRKEDIGDEPLTIRVGDEVFLYENTSDKSGGPEYFLKVREAPKSAEESVEEKVSN